MRVLDRMTSCEFRLFPALLGLCLLCAGAAPVRGYQRPGEHAGYQPPGEDAGYKQPEEDAGYQRPGEHVGYQRPGEHVGYQQPGEDVGYQRHTDDAVYQRGLRTLDHLVATRRGLSTLRAVISGIDSHLRDTQKRWSSCAVGLGMAGYQCHLHTLHADSHTRDWVANNPLSPGKRAALGPPPRTPRTAQSTARTAAARKVKDLSRKRKGLEIMKNLVDQMDSDLITEQKRTCAVNLGGHCATESAASMADQWHYLNSPLSPGRRRRAAPRHRRLLAGKLFED